MKENMVLLNNNFNHFSNKRASNVTIKNHSQHIEQDYIESMKKAA
jgi:hypothetical protein